MMLFHYLTLPVAAVIHACSPPDPQQPDAYLSKDHHTDALKDALSKGYRWIRTDGETAILERDLSVYRVPSAGPTVPTFLPNRNR